MEYKNDDTGNAERFVDLYRNLIKYNSSNKEWMYYNSKKWCSDGDLNVIDYIDLTIGDMEKDLCKISDPEELKLFERHVKNTRMLKGRNSMLETSKHHLAVNESDFDKEKFYFNADNCIIDLETMEDKLQHSHMLITKSSDVVYDKNAKCELWSKFLNDIFCGDTELVEYIQRAIGYSMSGDITEQCVFFCFGDGSNGKSTFVEILNELMGDYSKNIQADSIMVKKIGAGANPDIARLKGARLVTCVESSKGNRLDEGLIKQMTGGDKITARFLYGKTFEFTPEFKIWMFTNHKPIIRGTDDGMWRRTKYVPFEATFTDEMKDPQMPQKLKAELSGIFNWAIEGFVKWQKEGLGSCKAIEDATSEYRFLMDPLAKWLDELCDTDPKYKTSAKSLFESFKSWAIHDSEFLMNNTNFGIELSKRFDKKRDGGGNYYVGVGFKDPSKNLRMVK